MFKNTSILEIQKPLFTNAKKILFRIMYEKEICLINISNRDKIISLTTKK